MLYSTTQSWDPKSKIESKRKIFGNFQQKMLTFEVLCNFLKIKTLSHELTKKFANFLELNS